MPFPDSERVIYKNNPLIEVVCQLRFPTILRIGAGQPADFQDKIRQDYPIYRLQEPSIEFMPQIPKELTAILGQIRLPIPQLPSTHRFSTKDEGRFISLSQDFVALTETRYEKWDLFRSELAKAESTLKEVFKPAFYSRIGLRYRDKISRSALGLDNSEWSDLLKPHITAELGAKEVSHAIAGIQTRAIIRIAELPEAQVMLTHGLTKVTGTAEECYLIDADFSIEPKEGFGEPFDVLDKFNRLAGRLFRWAITEKLHNAMGPQRI